MGTIGEESLKYHRQDPPGKLEVVATKPLLNQRDLSLAYSPGVAAACLLIEKDPSEAASLTAIGNLIAVISNGTAVLGLGNIGALASKPVMEGKAVLFKKFANINVFDIEVNETDPAKFIEVVAALEPTFGGINLEDIKAPECFEIEARLRERMNIPVFHDDQHGTAIIVGAAVFNGLFLVKKSFEAIRVVCTGAGAAALACLGQLETLGLDKKNLWVFDRDGLIYEGRESNNPYNARYARPVSDQAVTLTEAMTGADLFMGLSGPGVIKPEMVKGMAEKPLILALANPTPEIMPEAVKEVRPDAIMATGRSDYPNQVNNVLCFPYMFRGALDVGATAINEAMKKAAVEAIARVARLEHSEQVQIAYGGELPDFGPEYLIPKPFDPRLIIEVSQAVAQAAMDSGIATRPIASMTEYKHKLSNLIYQSASVMRPLFDRATSDPKRIAFAEGEDPRILRAVQIIRDDGYARPVLIGRPKVVEARIKRLRLRIKVGQDFDLIDPEDDPRYREYWTLYHELAGRRGVTPEIARTSLRSQTTTIAGLMVQRGDADGFICGLSGRFRQHLEEIKNIFELRSPSGVIATLELLLLREGILGIADSFVNAYPTAEELVEIAQLSCEVYAGFGVEPRVAMLSHSNFGGSPLETSSRMAKAAQLFHERFPNIECDGDMRSEAALDPYLLKQVFPASRLTQGANLLIMPSADAGNIAFGVARKTADAISVGPFLLGVDCPGHILSAATTVRGIVNMTAQSVVDVQRRQRAYLEPEL